MQQWLENMEKCVALEAKAIVVARKCVKVFAKKHHQNFLVETLASAPAMELILAENGGWHTLARDRRLGASTCIDPKKVAILWQLSNYEIEDSWNYTVWLVRQIAGTYILLYEASSQSTEGPYAWLVAAEIIKVLKC